MRLLHIASHLNVGGVSRYLCALSDALAQRGHRVIIAADHGRCEPIVREMGATHWRVPLHTSVEFSPQVLAACWMLAARVRREPVDLIHAHTRVAQVVAARLSCALRVPYVTTWHGFFRPNLGRKWWPCTGDLTIAISEPVRRHLEQVFHVPSERIRLIPHGIDLAPFESPVDPPAQAAVRERAHLLPHGPVVGTISRLVRSKGLDLLIQSFSRVRASVPDAHLLIVGDGEDRARLERVARASGVEDAIHFSGTLPDVRAALSLMQLFVFLPAEQEGFGLSLLEAMASGRPIVAVRRGGGAPWVLQTSGVGIVVEPDDIDGLARAITQVLQDQALATRLGQQGRDVVRARYTRARMVDQVEAVYRELVSRASS